MPKGYWIAHVTVTDPDIYEAYKAANAKAFEKYGGRFLIRGGAFECTAGEARERHVVIEFDSYAQALACYRSPEYAAAIPHRDAAGSCDIIVIEGV